MNEDTISGQANAGVGRIQRAAGAALGDGRLRRAGAVREQRGRAQAALGSAEDIVSELADRVTTAVAQLRDQAKASQDRVTGAARSVTATVDPFVHERPYVALGVAVAVGVLAGLLMAGRGPKVIYVKPPAP